MLKKAFVKKPRPEEDPVEVLSNQTIKQFLTAESRMNMIEGMLKEQNEVLQKLAITE